MCCADGLAQHGLELRRQLRRAAASTPSRGPARRECADRTRTRSAPRDAGHLREARGQLLQLRYARRDRADCRSGNRRSRSCGSVRRRGSRRAAGRTPARDSSCVGSVRTSLDASRRCRNGEPARRMNATVGMSTSSGRRMTAVAMVCHQPRPAVVRPARSARARRRCAVRGERAAREGT